MRIVNIYLVKSFKRGIASLVIPKELWVISGRSPVLWTIPFLVTFEGSMAYLEECVLLMQRQRIALAERISLFAKKDKERHRWEIKKADLEQVGHVTPGGDPELYYSWSLPRPEQPAKEDPDREKRNEFLDAMFNAGVGRTRGELEYYWNQFCRHIIDWLLNKQKPVDFYFMTLHPTPYRANWMHVLSSRYPKLWRAVASKSATKRGLILLNSGFMDELISLDLLAYNHKESYCYRRIEVEYGKHWWKNVRAIEKQRMARKGMWDYARNVTDCVKRNLECSLRIYGSYLAQISRPSVAHVEGESFGDFRFVPNVPKGYKRFFPPAVTAIPPMLSFKIPDFTPARGTEEVPDKDGVMQKVPDVQPEEKILRHPGHELPGPEGQPAQTTGLPLLPADEKLAAS